MEKVIFTDPDTKEKIEFYVLEETQKKRMETVKHIF